MTQIECLNRLKKEGRVKFTQQNFSKLALRGVIPYDIVNNKRVYDYIRVVEELKKSGLHHDT